MKPVTKLLVMVLCAFSFYQTERIVAQRREIAELYKTLAALQTIAQVSDNKGNTWIWCSSITPSSSTSTTSTVYIGTDAAKEKERP